MNFLVMTMDFRVKAATVSYGLCKWRDPMDDAYITLEIDDERCGILQFELPLDVTDEEIAYIKSLVPSTERGFLELVDPDTREVIFDCTPVLVH